MKTVLLTGAGGFIGSHVRRRLERRGHRVLSTQGTPGVEIDLETPGAAEELVRRTSPDAVIHAAALSGLAECEADPDRADRVNHVAVLELADAARAQGARFVHFSTDQVFDGTAPPYTEESPRTPLHAYGRTKRDAERDLLAAPAGRVILRPTLVYGDSPTGRRSASEMILRAAGEGRTVALFRDEFRCPVPVDFVARAAADMIENDFEGLLNLAGPQRFSRLEFGRVVSEAYGLSPDVCVETQLLGRVFTPPRPADLTLDGTKARDILGFGPTRAQTALRVLAATPSGR